MNISSDDGARLFTEMVKTQQRQEQKVCERAIASLKAEIIPTPEDIRRDINGLVSRREEVLRNHVYWKEWQLRQGLDSLIRAAHQAYVDVCRHDAALGSLARAADFDKHIDHAIGDPAQKDVVAYCSLASGVWDTFRRIKSRRPDIAGEIQDVAKRYSEHDVAQFIKDLRKNLSHGSVVIPKWTISLKHPKPIGSMVYGKDELLAFGEWGLRAKSYIRNVEGDSISITQVVGDHFAHLENFGRNIQGLFGRNVTAEEIDFFCIEDSHKRHLKRQWILIFMNQFKGERDPYEYLGYYFDPKAVREILRLPKHSKEQVDFMIGLKSDEIECDEELRKKLYSVFGVNDQEC